MAAPSPPSSRARGTQMRTAMRVIPEEEGASRQPAAVYQGHLQSLWIDMTKEELEEEEAAILSGQTAAGTDSDGDGDGDGDDND